MTIILMVMKQAKLYILQGFVNENRILGYQERFWKGKQSIGLSSGTLEKQGNGVLPILNDHEP